jgi:Pilus formation protein N terminal region
MRVCTASGAGRARRACILFGLVSALISSAAQAEPASAPSAGMTLIVHLDQAGVLKLPERTATLIIGNPLIADANVQPGGIAVITGKSYGATNLIALDRSGTTLMEHPIQVLAPRDYVVVVYRGIERESYSCTPTCERRIALGDSKTYFENNLANTVTLNAQAQGGGEQK